MKCIIKTKLISIFVILTSIHFIYSGCCCGSLCSNSGNNNSSSNSKGKPGGPGTGKPGGPGTGKPGGPDTGNKPEENTVVETTEDKKKAKEEKKRNYLVGTKVKTYLEKRDGNRTNIKDKFSFLKNGELYILKYLKFVGHIKVVDTNTINDKSSDDVIGNLKVQIKVDSYKENVSYNFTNNECTLEQLIKSLNTLDEKLRADPTEYLCVLYEDEGDEYKDYINLKNGIVYHIHTSKSGPFNLLMRDGISVNDPLYCNGIFYSQKLDAFTPLDDQTKAAEEFNTPIPGNDISKYKYTIACKY